MRTTGLRSEAGADAIATRVLHKEKLLTVRESAIVVARHEERILIALEEGEHR